MDKKVDNIIVAADFTNFEEFQNLFTKTRDIFSWYKIHSIFLLEHKRVSDILRNNGKKIFLDLKFFDIPATVEKHVEVISNFADMFTVHLLSGRECLKKVVNVSKDKGITPVGVSILTSFSDNDLKDIGIDLNIKDEVIRLVEIGVDCGINHFVCSPLEIESIKRIFPNVKLITPGIRIFGNTDDQKRVMSLKEAFTNGADFVVMGRDILRLDKVEDIFSYL